MTKHRIKERVGTMFTLREGFGKAREYFASVGDTEMVEFFDARLAQVEKKATAVRKPTPHQVENEAFKADILDWLESGKDYVLADIHKGVPSIIAAGLSSSRVSAMLTALVKSGDLTAEKVKGKNVYRLA